MVSPSQLGFTVLVALVALQRLWELRKSKQHEVAILKAGGREHARAQMPVMRALHGAWLLSMLVEVFALHRPFVTPVAALALFGFAGGQVLRLAAMRSLGPRWTVKIMTLPGAPAVSAGVFRWVRHPNYVGVALEIAALPLVHGAWWTSVFFTVANGVLLRERIRAEEDALTADNGYEQIFDLRPRFVPRLKG